VIEISTATGAATLTGSTSASSGTAISASPNPNADRMSVAPKKTATTATVIQLLTRQGYSEEIGPSRSPRRDIG
jgi:hypothetical protein